MSLSLLAIYAFVTIVLVTYAGAKAFYDYFVSINVPSFSIGGWEVHLTLINFAWVLGIFAAVYVLYGGLKSAAWAGSLQGTALILCGVVILIFALIALGKADKPTLQAAADAIQLDFPDKTIPTADELEKAGALGRFSMLNAPKLRMNQPWNDMSLPITALLFGLWIPNLYYWGCDQHIMQRTLGSKSLAQGQKGIVLAAFLKLLIPFVVIFPGLIAFNLYNADMRHKAFEGKGGYEALATEHSNLGQLFDFDNKFAKFYPEDAKKMIEFNAEKTGIKAPENLDAPFAALQEHKKQYKDPKFGKQVAGYDYDSAFGLLLGNLVPYGGFRGFALAALFGMVVSAMAAMLNAVSTLFSMDIYREFIHRKASESELVFIGRVSVIGFMVLACSLVPVFDNPKFGGLFQAIQEFQGFISPGILAAFMFGFFVHRLPRWSGVIPLLMSPVIYGSLMFLRPNTAFLDRMAITFSAIVIVMLLIRLIAPMKEKFTLQANTTMDLQTSKVAVVLGVVVVVLTAVLYAFFWDYQTPMWNGFIESFSK
jgi:SSS family solute:Na+ symporter